MVICRLIIIISLYRLSDIISNAKIHENFEYRTFYCSKESFYRNADVSTCTFKGGKYITAMTQLASILANSSVLIKYLNGFSVYLIFVKIFLDRYLYLYIT